MKMQLLHKSTASNTVSNTAEVV